MNKSLKVKSNVVFIAVVTGWLGIILREIGWEGFGDAVFNISLIVAALFGLAGLIDLAKKLFRERKK